MNFEIKCHVDKVQVLNKEGKLVGEFDSLASADAFCNSFKSNSSPVEVPGFIVAKESPDLVHYDLPERAVASEEAASIIEKFTIGTTADYALDDVDE